MPAPQTYAQHARATLVLGVPLIGSHLAQFAIGLTDAVMLGWYSVQVLAAQVLGGMMFFILFLIGSGFAWAVMPIVAAAAASDDERQVRRVTRMSMWLCGGFGIAMLPVFLMAGRLFTAAGQDADVAALAQQYVTIAGPALVPALVVMVLKSYLAALERTRVVLLVTIAAALLNAVVNYALIFGHWGAPELGIRGAAAASLCVHVASLVALVIYASRATPEHALFQRLWRPDWGALAQVVRLGLPIGLTSLAETGLFAASSVMMGWLGAVPLATHGIALQITSAMFMAQVGLSNAATIRAGRAFGMRDAEALKRGARVVLAMAGVSELLATVVLLGMPVTLLELFVDPASPERAQVIAIGTGLLAASALFQLVDAAQINALGLLRGVQDTRAPMVMAVVSYWLVGMPVSYVLGFVIGWEGVGIWLGLASGLALASALMLARFWRRSMRRV